MADVLDILSQCAGFDWDEHNAIKIYRKHKVEPSESEEVFFNRPLVLADDVRHSEKENRFYALGVTNAGRTLFVVFTVRQDLIRVISAREMSRREREVFESHEQEKEGP